MKIILGSSSKGRQAVLVNHGYEFTVMAPDIDEKAIRSDDYYQTPVLIARAKANALVPKITEPALLITADQVIICDSALQEKPESDSQAREFLQKYSRGLPAISVSALAVTNTETGKRAEGVDITTVYFKTIPDTVIEEYIKHGNLSRYAGGFELESGFITPYIERIEGVETDTRGMSIYLLKKLLLEAQGG